MSCRVIRETCVAGACIDVTIKLNTMAHGARKPKSNPTSDAVRENNDRLAEKNLTRLLNANFYPGDLHVTLTYEEAPTKEEAEKEKQNFLRRMSREFKKIEKEFRWVAVTEHENHRIHHHIVMSYIDMRIIHKQWKRGHIRSSVLDATRNYSVLANYLIKETQKTFRQASNATKRRYSCSRNLVKPIVVREVMSSVQLYEKPRDIKGYHIDENSIRYYTHPFTQLEHLEYMMVSTDPVPRVKKWRKGKVVRRTETLDRFEELKQLDIFEEFEMRTI